MFQGFPGQQYGSGGMSGYPSQPLQYPTGPQQRCAPSPSYPSSRMPHMGQYGPGSHNPAQFPPGAGQPNPPQYYKVTRPAAPACLSSAFLCVYRWIISCFLSPVRAVQRSGRSRRIQRLHTGCSERGKFKQCVCVIKMKMKMKRT